VKHPRWAPWYFLCASALFGAGFLYTGDPVALVGSVGLLVVSGLAARALRSK